ncbi:AraC family transcriptional regulator [Streptomyces sp. NPDC051921]|uniref:AraC family transcriptional regulator n=1 Tax=Streptomyces sp. NPDC051921 TaxID=3155806 RepID=UPI00342B3088
MIGTTFRTDDVPLEGRFDWWREMILRTRSAEIVSPHAADFRAELRHMELGPVTVLHSSFAPARIWRTSRMARRSDTGTYHVTLLTDGAVAMTADDGRTEAHGPRDIHVIDSSQAFELRPCEEGRALAGIGVDFPQALLPLPPQRVQHLRGKLLSAREGTGALLADLLAGLLRHADLLSPADAPRLGATVLDLVHAWLAHVLDAEATLSAETREWVLTERVQTFVRRRLHDPELTPVVIAAAHHVSLSHLHRVFTQQSGGQTLAAWIRARRLEGTHRALADPVLRATPIHVVASRWGFTRASDFTRAFRATYGMTPREHRRQALAAAGS